MEVTSKKNDLTLKEILAQIPGHIYFKDNNGNYLGSNTNNWRDAGLKSLPDIIGKTDNDLIPKIEAKQIHHSDAKVIKIGKPITVEEEVTLPNGKKTLYLSLKAPLKNLQNQIIGIIGNSIDITNAKQETTDRLALLEDVISLMPGNVYWMNRRGIYLGCNEKGAKLLGLKSRKDIVGKRNVDLNSSHINPAILDPINEKVMATGEPITIEEPATLRDGTKATYLSTKSPLYDTKGNITGLVGISQDITDRKKIEEKLNQALISANASNNAKTEFLENMRHNVRIPLTGIIGFAELLKEQVPESTKTREYVDKLIASSNSLLVLINEILEAVKVVSGETPILKQAFNLEEKILEIIRLNSAYASQKKLKLTLNYPGNIPHYFTSDPIRIKRVVLELVNNALKFTNKGGVKIKVQLIKQTTKNCVVEISVSDTGIGIPKNKQHKIFEKFTRLTPSAKGIYEGQGLGLAIAKQFIKDLHGKIKVISKLNHGAQFICTLPLEAATPQTINQNIAILTPLGTHNIKRSCKVLLVEDHELAAEIASNLLTRLGCKVDTAINGSIALQLVKTKLYDLILMDIGLPDIDGYIVTKQIRRNKRAKNHSTPIVALTAHAVEEHSQKCTSAGMNAVLAKPLTKENAEQMLSVFVHTQPRKEQPKIIDVDLAMSILDNNQTLLNKLLQKLIANFPSELAALRLAYQEKKWDTLQRLAHRLRGGATYCGATSLKEAAAKLDQYCVSHKVPKQLAIDPLYQQLIQAITVLQNYSHIHQQVILD